MDILGSNGLSKKLFLTFDIDWAVDEVLEHTHKILVDSDVKSTIFVTHNSPYIKVLGNDKNVELGIHPNFIPLLNSTSEGEGYPHIIDKLLAIVPNAISFRSHALVQSSHLSTYLSRYMKYDLNSYIPQDSGMILKPSN